MIEIDGKQVLTELSELVDPASTAPDPNGGLFLVGHFSLSGPAPKNRVALKMNRNGGLQYGPVPFPSDAAIFGQVAVDFSARRVQRHGERLGRIEPGAHGDDALGQGQDKRGEPELPAGVGQDGCPVEDRRIEHHRLDGPRQRGALEELHHDCPSHGMPRKNCAVRRNQTTREEFLH